MVSDKSLGGTAHELRLFEMIDFSANTESLCTAKGLRFGWRDWVAILVLCAITVAVLGKDITRGSMIDPDAAAHAMDGVLIHDWLLAGPGNWVSPMRFAREQYGHYPTLGIGGHYPPGFALIEALFFLVLGVSAASARWCVVFFGAIAAVGCYRFMRTWTDSPTAILAAVLLVSVPSSTEWGRQIMLEVPMMAVLIWAAVALLWYLDKPTWTRLAAASALSLAAVAFKQSGIFLLGVQFATLGHQYLRARVPLMHVVVAGMLAMATLIGVLITLDDASFKTISGYATIPLLSVQSFIYYPSVMPDVVGWLVLITGLMGALLSLRVPLAPAGMLLFAWMFLAFVMILVTNLKTPRFSYVLVFPLVVWAAFAIATLAHRLADRWLRRAIWVTCSLVAAGIGFARPVADGPDFGPIVKDWRDGIDNQVVLFSGLRDGDFVFAVRENVPWRRSVVLRGSKLFYTCIAPPNLEMKAYVHSPDELAQLMRRFAFREVVIERENLAGIVQDDWLRDYLKRSGDYTLMDTRILDGRQIRGKRMIHVDRYRLVRPLERQVHYFDIPVPRTRDTIRIPFPSHTGNPS